MSELVFTDYVRCLASGRDPSSELQEKFWTRLRGALVAEMKTRSLWTVPPARLCFPAQASWSHSGEALEELLHDCYISVLLERLQGLAAQLKVNPDVEGLVFRNLKNFLTALQKRFDPVGYRIYERLRDTVSRAVHDGRMDVLEGERRIENRTLLGFVSCSHAAVATSAELLDHARRWADDLLPDLILAGGCRQKGVLLERLAARLELLPGAGVGRFRFKDLADALKAAVRPRWHAVCVAHHGDTAIEESGDVLEIVHIVRPVADYEDRQAFSRLLDCVDCEIDQYDARERTRSYLRRLWEYVKTSVTENGEKRPGQRQLSALLGIPRERFQELDGLLRLWVDLCRREESRR